MVGHHFGQSFNVVTGTDTTYESLIRASAGHPELIELIQRRTHARRNEYRLAVNRAIARGEVGPDVDVDLVFDLLYGPLWFRILVSKRPIHELNPESLVDTVLQVIHAGPGTHPGASDA